MTEKDIRPIPKNILKRIRKLDGKYYPSPDGHVRCYAYLTTWKNELVKVTVAVKHRYKKWYCKQVAIHGVLLLRRHGIPLRLVRRRLAEVQAMVRTRLVLGV